MNRCTLLFSQSTEDNRVGGWSESWYKDGDPAVALASLRDLARVRAPILAAQGKIIGLRVAVIGGGSISEPIDLTGQSRLASDLPMVAALCSITDATLTKKKIFTLRGIPDDNVLIGRLTNASALYAQIFAFARALAAGGFAFRAKDTSVAPVPLVSVSNVGAFVFGAPVVFNVGDIIQVLRSRDTLGSNASGFYRVETKVNDTSGTFTQWPGFIIERSGSVRKAGFTYPSVNQDSMKIIRAITKKVGRPFGQFIGRSSRRR